MIGRIPKRAAKLAVAILAATALMAVAAGAASAATVFNNFESTASSKQAVSSLNIPQYAISAFGAQVGFTHATTPSTVSVLLSSWACQSGEYGNGTCATSTGATFELPITLNIYKVQGTGPGEEAITTGANQPGALIASHTQTAKVPYRPSTNKKCPTTGGEGNDAYGWRYHGKCYNGDAFYLNYTEAELGNVRLPEKVIISVAYNPTEGLTTEAKTAALSLNVGLNMTPTNVLKGELPLASAEQVYINSTECGLYEPFATGSSCGTFTLASEWNYQPVFKVKGSKK
jgi:hypothetical protein